MIIDDIGNEWNRYDRFFTEDMMRYIADNDAPILSFYYDKKRRRFVDEDGFVINDIYKYISPLEMYLFLRRKEYTLIIDPDDYLIELLYEYDEDSYE